MLKRKNRIYLAPFVAVCTLALSACYNVDEPLPNPDSGGKTPIELTVGVIGEPSAATRTVVTTDQPYGQSATAFSSGTSIYMVMKSEKDDAGAVYTRTIGYAQENADAANTLVKFASAYGRFWEDSYSRNSQLSVYAACVPGYYLAGSVYDGVTPNGTSDEQGLSINNSSTYSNTWSGDLGTATIAWPLRGATVTHQNAAFVNSQDLCFSNNVSDAGNGRVTFNESLKKFGSGRMVFYHALTKVTFRIKKGEGFLEGDPFAFTNANENIVLKGFNTSGTFDITTGEFLTSLTIGTGDITELYSKGASSGYVYELECLMLPRTDLNNDTRDQIYFTIDNNLYHLTKKQMMDALAGKKLSDANPDANPPVAGTDALTADHKMRPGVHYIFDMTVGKKKMDNFTAAVVPWETVTAEETTPSNARIIVTLLDNGGKKTGTADFDLFRSPNESTGDAINDDFESYAWTTGYAPTDNPIINKAQLEENATGSGVYTAKETTSPFTDWYWPNNKTFYHFRIVMPKTTDSWKVLIDNNGTTTDTSDDLDYITLEGGHFIAEGNEGNYRDVCWGAPFYAKDATHLSTPLNADKLTYSLTTGFDNTGTNPVKHQIYKAIGPTSSTINLEMFHMMSDVTIQLTTSVSGDEDYDARVDLANAKMELSNIYPTGKVLMGNGLVTPTGTVSTVDNIISGTKTVPWRHGFVPQDLTNVVLTITTSDNNQYFVDMKDVKATTVGNNLIANPYSKDGEKYVIGRWYPNYKYTYTFKLVKTGIALISATLANWETVTAGDDNVQIK